MQISTIGIDIGKNSFHFVGFDARGGIVVRRQCSRTQLIRTLATLPPCLVGMEACCGAHHLGRILIAQGHDVRLIPPQYVKPFVKSHKNDLLDAEAIGEAVQRPTMRFVPLKTMEQLDLQAIHRLRTRLVARRTAVINQMRGFLLERGVTCPVGREALVKRFPEVLDNPALGLSVRFCRLLQQLRDEWRLLDDDIEDVDQEILSLARDDEACDRLMQVPGIGPLTATALVAAVGNGAAFAKGRDLAAWLGLVPRQHSTGGKTVLRELVNVAMPISGACSFMAHDPSAVIITRSRIAWDDGSRVSRPGPIRTWSSSRSRTNWCERPRLSCSDTPTTTGGSSRMRDAWSLRAAAHWRP